MRECDIAITGGGQTLFELAATGTPSMAIRLVDNQTSNLNNLTDLGIVQWIGDAADHDLDSKLSENLALLANDKHLREKMSHQGQAYIDGQGAKRVALEIMRLSKR